MNHQDPDAQRLLGSAQDGESQNKERNPAPSDRPDKPVSRRGIFASAQGFAALFLAACSSSDFVGTGVQPEERGGKSSTSGKGKSDTDGKKGDADGDGDGDGGSTKNNNGTLQTQELGEGGDELEGCKTANTPKVDLKETRKAEGNEIPAIKFYGRPKSTMMAVHFDKSQKIEEVIVTKADGTMMALHATTGADKNGDSWRPILFDNLKAEDTDSLNLLVQTADGQYKHEVTIEYFDTFKGSPVVDLGGHTVPMGFKANQAVAQFANTGGFDEDKTVEYPKKNAQTYRYLQTAQSNATWSVGSATLPAGSSTILTDVMGNEVSMNGAGIFNHQTFCAYVPQNGTYYRTMLKIG